MDGFICFHNICISFLKLIIEIFVKMNDRWSIKGLHPFRDVGDNCSIILDLCLKALSNLFDAKSLCLLQCMSVLFARKGLSWF